jgi:hypothetical protein
MQDLYRSLRKEESKQTSHVQRVLQLPNEFNIGHMEEPRADSLINNVNNPKIHWQHAKAKFLATLACA